jgi:hypothetical protein
VARLRAREGVGRRREVIVMTPRVPPIRRGPWTRGARRGAPVRRSLTLSVPRSRSRCAGADWGVGGGARGGVGDCVYAAVRTGAGAWG